MNWTENATYRPVCGNTSKQTRDWRGEDRYQNGAVNYLAECSYRKAAWNISLLWSHTRMNLTRHYTDDNTNQWLLENAVFSTLLFNVAWHHLPSVAGSCIICFSNTDLWKPRNTDRDSQSKPTQINEILRQFISVTSYNPSIPLLVVADYKKLQNLL